MEQRIITRMATIKGKKYASVCDIGYRASQNSTSFTLALGNRMVQYMAMHHCLTPPPVAGYFLWAKATTWSKPPMPDTPETS